MAREADILKSRGSVSGFSNKPLPQRPEVEGVGGLGRSMTVHQDDIPRSVSDMSLGSTLSTVSPVKRKASPTSKFSSFFGWKSSPRPNNINESSPATTFSDASQSPAHSPVLTKPKMMPRLNTQTKASPAALDVKRANETRSLFPDENNITPFAPPTPTGADSYRALEAELREISTELANSIKREMELEDELEKYKLEMPQTQPDGTRRTSDYFSDSGASSTRNGYTDGLDVKNEDHERVKRKLEQDKAQIRADYSQEIQRRRELEDLNERLKNELHVKGQDVQRLAEIEDKNRSLESSLEDTRRRLTEERQSKDNFEDLLAALRSELEMHRNERDNLRDEVVPQLQSRVQGLETEAAEASKLRYENSRMQQEIQQSQKARNFEAIEEESADSAANTSTPSRFGLSRSMSLARSGSVSNRVGRNGSLSRSGSVKNRNSIISPSDVPDTATLDRFKDLEDQRDALHRTLKNLIQRHRKQQEDHAKAIRELTKDRDVSRPNALIRSNFTRDVNRLRDEVSILRRRADDALEQKGQYENNLGSVKMALDRAGQETQSLRSLLAGTTDEQAKDKHVNNVGGLGITMGENGKSHDTQSMIRILRHSIILAENERDAALTEAEAYRQRAKVLQTEHEDREGELAMQLINSAKKMEELAAQVQSHLQANVRLRERLAAAVGKGESEQSDSTALVIEMQSRLRGLEEGVLAAQQQSEYTLSTHEEEARALGDAAIAKSSLQRLRAKTTGDVSGALTKSPPPPLFLAKSPKIGTTTSGPAETLMEVSRTKVLEDRVRELESALGDADKEMQSVVKRIESSQYEIAELQGERSVVQLKVFHDCLRIL